LDVDIQDISLRWLNTQILEKRNKMENFASEAKVQATLRLVTVEVT
jgi:hypothetical protein